ncbi:MAG: hypothetical protein IT529_21560 [Burkholderiales bacterium]|nr:hypothetical protein [Burkholderiales bacterium]
MATRRDRVAIWVLSLLATACAVLGLWFATQNIREGAAIRAYLSERSLSALPVSRASAIAVSDAVRADFLVDETRWRRLSMSRRPFLRHDTLTLLEAREGLCGEGTRVIVNLLLTLGFDATRVVLYDEQLQAVHALVSVVIDGKESLIDSINSPEGLNAILRANPIGVDSFDLVPYTGDILSARELKRRTGKHVKDPRLAAFWLYSYEAVPLTKLFNVLALNVRAFNHTRPYRWLSLLAEKPNLLLAISWASAMALAVLAIVIVLLRGGDASRSAARAWRTDSP